MTLEGKGSAPPRIAVLGAGYWGQNLVRNFQALGALEIICDSDLNQLAKFKSQYPGCAVTSDFKDVLSNPKIAGVSIATPAVTHADMVRKCLDAGKDVLVEKPLALSFEDGQDLVRRARDAKRILMVGHLLWYHPAVLKLKELVVNGELGRIQYIYSNRLNLGKIRREENILWSFAPHDISVILGLLGEMPDGVFSQGGNYLHQKISDVTVSLLSFPSGVKAHIFVSWLHPFKEQKLVVVGDRQMAVFNDVDPEHKLVLFPHVIQWADGQPIARKAELIPVPFEAAEPLSSECSHFLDCIRTRQVPRTDGAEGLRVLTVLRQCQDAVQEPFRRDAAKPASAPRLSYFAHESAFIDEGVDIGEGTSIWHVSHVLKGSRLGKKCKIGQNVVIGPHVTIGDGVKIQNNVSVYEGVTLEDHVFCGPSMVFTNVFNPRSEILRMNELRRTLVKRGASLGANCTILCGVTIGKYAFVGAGSVVTKDVPDYALVMGNPGRVKGHMCECGTRLEWNGEEAACSCGKRYKKTASGDVQALERIQNEVRI
jgi:UDP-2-acetamido-3-amino-2,3-dideoxy-glucuronate N-acetyltransferase